MGLNYKHFCLAKWNTDPDSLIIHYAYMGSINGLCILRENCFHRKKTD